jgi:hypothetical protein
MEYSNKMFACFPESYTVGKDALVPFFLRKARSLRPTRARALSGKHNRGQQLAMMFLRSDGHGHPLHSVILSIVSCTCVLSAIYISEAIHLQNSLSKQSPCSQSPYHVHPHPPKRVRGVRVLPVNFHLPFPEWLKSSHKHCPKDRFG